MLDPHETARIIIFPRAAPKRAGQSSTLRLARGYVADAWYGTADELVAAGIVAHDLLPHQPGPKVTAFRDGELLEDSSELDPDTICSRLRGRQFSVTKHVSFSEAERRRMNPSFRPGPVLARQVRLARSRVRDRADGRCRHGCLLYAQ